MRLDGEAWSDYWANFRTEAFRLELLPQYLVAKEAEAFAAFTAGQPVVPAGAPAWHSTIAAAAARNAVIRRVHVVRRPLSPYLRFEFTYYDRNERAGEQIRILDLDAYQGPELDLPDTDFWMFDERAVVAMLYEPDGTQIGRELLADPDVGAYVGWRDAAWNAAVPFREYVDGVAAAGALG